MRVAIVGSGISGLAAAHTLSGTPTLLTTKANIDVVQQTLLKRP
ncbi:MAG: hypothetical protein JWQ13_451 [Ramlibacter sp.]|jgi:predicted NAD/FAD-binding protein|nr:hypothetical protein [Ramlibacter sp.]